MYLNHKSINQYIINVITIQNIPKYDLSNIVFLLFFEFFPLKVLYQKIINQIMINQKLNGWNIIQANENIKNNKIYLKLYFVEYFHKKYTLIKYINDSSS